MLKLKVWGGGGGNNGLPNLVNTVSPLFFQNSVKVKVYAAVLKYVIN